MKHEKRTGSKMKMRRVKMINRNEYLEISKQIVACIGGMENIQGTAHCATRLRIVLQDNSLANIEKLEEIHKVKGAFIAGNQLQLIFGAGVVNDVYDVFAEYTHTQNMSLGDLKEQSNKKQNPVQAVIKSLSDVFIGIMPALLAAALLMGITSVLGGMEVVKTHDTLYAINRLVSLAATGIFAILPMAVCYSAVKRFGGNPVLGMVVGAIMLDSSLANAYQAAQGAVDPEIIRLFGLKIEMVGFQGGIIIALMMGWVVAKLDNFFNRKIPDVVKLLVAPMLTVFISTVLLFTIVGPVGRILSNGITDGLVWSTNHLGAFGYALFAGIQQIVVITGLHHIIGAVEAQLIGEPAIFGVNLRYRFPLIGGCIGGAAAGAYVYFSKLTALGFGTTALPGMAIANPANHGYINYIVAHVIALAIGFVATAIIGKMWTTVNKAETIEEETNSTDDGKKAEAKDVVESIFYAPAEGEVKSISESSDQTFSKKILGDGVVVFPENGFVMSPCNAKVKLVYPTGHAVGLETEDGTVILIHCGIDTVNMKGEGFEVFVKEGQQVAAGDMLVKFDKELVESKGYSSEILVVFTEVPTGNVLKINEQIPADRVIAEIEK